MNPLRVLLCLVIGCVLSLLPACGGQGSNPGSQTQQKFGDYLLFDTRYDYNSATTAKENVANMLTQLADHKKVCMIGLWAYNPPAIYNAVEQAGKFGQVKIVGFDEDALTLQGIREGHIYATVVQQPFQFGYQSVELMKKMVEDPKYVVEGGIHHIPHQVIKKDNVEQFEKKLKEDKESAKGKSKPPGGTPIKVGFVSNNAEDFWSIAEAGTIKAANDFGVEVLFRRPQSGTAADQQIIIKDLLTQGVQAIAISVNAPEDQLDLLNEVADKIPLITQDNDAPKSRRRCYVGTDNYTAGREVGKLVKEAMPGGGTIGIFVGKPDPINARERRQGVLDELAGAKDARGK